MRAIPARSYVNIFIASIGAVIDVRDDVQINVLKRKNLLFTVSHVSLPCESTRWYFRIRPGRDCP